MQAVKVNIFISHAPEDRPQLDKLLRWLYPMRDEVNLWYSDPPKRPIPLTLPWQILLFWYIPPDNRPRYRKALKAQLEKSHIYLFLTSYNSLSNRDIEDEIDIAARRRIKGDDLLGPFIYPILLSPSRWKKTSRLAGFEPMAEGKDLASFKQDDAGYLAVTEELSALIKVLQTRLGEAKFHKSRDATVDSDQISNDKRIPPYLGESDGTLAYQEIEPFEPPEWLGWSLLLFLFISFLGSLMPSRVMAPSRYDNIESDNEKSWEYPRENPMMPPRDSIVFPPPE